MRSATGVLWVVVALAAASARAQDEVTAPSGPDLRDLMSARNFGMGNVFLGLGYGSESVGGNPAALSLFKRYQIEASGAYDFGRQFGFGTAALADSTGAWAMGASYSYISYGEDARRTAHVTTIAASVPIADIFHIGVSGRYHGIAGATNAAAFTLNAGVALRPWPWLVLGVSGHNLIASAVDVQRFVGASASVILFEQLTPAVEVRMDFNQPDPRVMVNSGVEWLIGQLVPVRLGYSFDGIRGQQYLSAGLGLFIKGSGADLAYRHELTGNGRLLALTVKVQLGE